MGRRGTAVGWAVVRALVSRWRVGAWVAGAGPTAVRPFRPKSREVPSSITIVATALTGCCAPTGYSLSPRTRIRGANCFS